MDLLISDKTNRNIKTSIIQSLSYIRKIIYSDSDKDNSEITVNEIIILLKWLSTITEGNKLYITSLTISPNNLFTKLYRTFIKSESREDTLEFLYFIINKSLEILDDFNTKLNECDNENKKMNICFQINNLVNAICDSVSGIISLKKTYDDDKMFSCFIDNLIENLILSKFLELKNIKHVNINEDRILSKLKSKEIKIDENYNPINKEIKVENEVLKTEEPNFEQEFKNEPKKELKFSKEFKEDLKEFQISRELKDLKKKDNESDYDYDNDVFDE